MNSLPPNFKFNFDKYQSDFKELSLRGSQGNSSLRIDTDGRERAASVGSGAPEVIRPNNEIHNAFNNGLNNGINPGSQLSSQLSNQIIGTNIGTNIAPSTGLHPVNHNGGRLANEAQ